MSASREKLAAVGTNRNPDAIKFAIVQMALAGKSYLAIAKEMGTTKGLVAGVVYRARKALDRKSPAPSKAPAQRPRPALVSPPVARVAAESPRPVWQPKPVAFFDIRDGLCRWPLWSSRTPFSEKFFCGLPTDGDVYCAHCSDRGTNPRATVWLDSRLGISRSRAAA